MAKQGGRNMQQPTLFIIRQIYTSVYVRVGYTGSSKKMEGIWNRYNLKSTRRIYTFPHIQIFE